MKIEIEVDNTYTRYESESTTFTMKPTGEFRKPKLGEYYVELGDDYVYKRSGVCYYNGPGVILEPMRWRAEFGQSYFTIETPDRINRRSDARGDISSDDYKSGNYFQTKEEAEKMLFKIKQLLGERVCK